jgi:hypothetical protein
MPSERASDGVLRTPGSIRARVLVALAVAFVAGLGIAGWMALRPEAPMPAAPSGPPTPSDQPTASERPHLAPLERAMLKALPLTSPPAQPEEDEKDDKPGELPEMTIDQLSPGDGTGLDAFPRPGTKPIQRGLIVPDGYALPPGFVRHFQTTDTGEQLPPILKFHPDHAPPGAPPDRTVPPELAPADMPRRWLEPPPPKGNP